MGTAQRNKGSRSVVSDSLQPHGLARQAPPSMGFSRQEYWSGLPFSSPEDLLDPGIELRSPILQADFLPSEPGLRGTNKQVKYIDHETDMCARKENKAAKDA